MAQTKKDTPVIQTWIYLGTKYIPNKKKLWYIYQEYKESGLVGDTKSFDQNCHHAVGAVYEIETFNEGSTAILSGAKYKFIHDDEEVVAGWRASSRASETENQLMKKEKKDKQVDHLVEFLEPLRLQYQGRRGVNATAFELAVLQALRKPVRK